ncbi:3'-5' exonuclease [Salmonella enterica]|nr:3'-5' exonuclease [Salmonella enterica]EJG3989063.1 3'-5' exonuclease [Salmonella enterica]
MTRSRVCPDTESTGLSPASDALPETAIISDTGVPLLNTLICPPDTFKARPAAQAAHCITPAMVRDKFTPDKPASRIRTAVQDQDVIIYNASFDASFPGDLLAGARSVQCCMLAWARHVGEWSGWHGDWRLHRLDQAAAAVCFDWSGDKHRALADARACRAVWQFMNDESERRRVDIVRHDRQLIREAGRLLSAEQREQEQRHQERQQRTDRFIRHWWLRCPDLQAHWSATLPVRETTEQFAQVFFGKSMSLLTLEDRFTTVYTCSRDIPADLHPASWFPADTWFRNELRACAACVGRRQGWPLYHASEAERLRALYPLRLATPATSPGEQLLTRTALLKAGYSRATIAVMTPVAERQNRHSGDWYPLYRVQTETRVDSGEKT